MNSMSLACPRTPFLVLAGLIATGPSAFAAAMFSTNIDFNESAFPTSNTAVSGTVGYNILNDTTGMELASLNGDLDDISLSFTSNGANTDWEYVTTASGSFRANHSYPTAATTTNPGTLISNSVTMSFGSHLSVTDFSFDASSLNSRGAGWEYSVIEFLDPSGNPFTTAPVISAYGSHTAVDGSPSQGVYLLDQTTTVTNVGMPLTAAGASNANENFTVTGDLEYSDVGLAPGTQIGGIRMTTFLEDVRGEDNNATNFTSSLIDFTFEGMIMAPVPEPSRGVLLAAGLMGVLVRRQR